MTDTLAARLRAALVGDYTGDVMPFDELKPEIQARWQRVADVARTRAEVPAPIRVPFSDAQIERMAKAARDSTSPVIPWEEADRSFWRRCIRAALAAGGLEPCAVPEYDPADVALAPTGRVLRDRLVEAEAKIERQRAELKRLNALVADLRAEVDEDNANAASVNDLLVQVQNLTAERDRLRERASVPVKVRIAQPAGMMEFRWLEICRKYGPENDVDACPWLQDVLCDFADYLAAHAVIDAPAGVPSVEELIGAARSARPDYAIDAAQVTAIRDAVLASVPSVPTDDQVEALARVLREAWGGSPKLYTESWRNAARAAIAHLSKRPEGLPTLMQIEDAYYADPDRTTEPIEFTLDYLRPWLRDPVGCELDVTAEEVFDEGCRAYMQSSGITTKPEMDRDDRAEVQAVIDLCRSRIRPVFECKECAKKDTRIDMYDRQQNMMAKSIEVQRQGLERAAAAARAALEGE